MSHLSDPQRASGKPGALYVALNQDNTCLVLGTLEGITIYNLDMHKVCYKYPVGAVSIVEMLFCTSLVTYVGAGEQPALTPRKLTVMNTSTNKVIQDLNFPTSVLAVRMNRQRLVVLLNNKALVYALENLMLLRTLETPSNPEGLCALCSSAEPNLLALPTSAATGTLRVYDLLADGSNVLCEVNAHRTPLKIMAWSPDGSMLATASTKGTIIRVHRVPHAAKAFSYRRGTYPATISSMSFSPASVEPGLLCVSSSHGTIHIFRLDTAEQKGASGSSLASLFTAVTALSMTEADPPRHFANIRLPCQGVPVLCAMLARDRTETENGQKAAAEVESDSVTVVVASMDGIIYEYNLQELSSPHGPKCLLGGEWKALS